MLKTVLWLTQREQSSPKAFHCVFEENNLLLYIKKPFPILCTLVFFYFKFSYYFKRKIFANIFLVQLIPSLWWALWKYRLNVLIKLFYTVHPNNLNLSTWMLKRNTSLKNMGTEEKIYLNPVSQPHFDCKVMLHQSLYTYRHENIINFIVGKINSRN